MLKATTPAADEVLRKQLKQMKKQHAAAMEAALEREESVVRELRMAEETMVAMEEEAASLHEEATRAKTEEEAQNRTATALAHQVRVMLTPVKAKSDARGMGEDVALTSVLRDNPGVAEELPVSIDARRSQEVSRLLQTGASSLLEGPTIHVDQATAALEAREQAALRDVAELKAKLEGMQQMGGEVDAAATAGGGGAMRSRSSEITANIRALLVGGTPVRVGVAAVDENAASAPTEAAEGRAAIAASPGLNDEQDPFAHEAAGDVPLGAPIANKSDPFANPFDDQNDPFADNDGNDPFADDGGLIAIPPSSPASSSMLSNPFSDESEDEDDRVIADEENPFASPPPDLLSPVVEESELSMSDLLDRLEESESESASGSESDSSEVEPDV